MTVSFPLSMCHVGILLTRVGHLHDCVIPSIYVSCRDFTHTGSTPTRIYHSPYLCVKQGFTHGQDIYMTVSSTYLCVMQRFYSRVGHLHDCIIPSIYVSCRDFTHTGRTPTRMYHSPHLCVMQIFHSHEQDTYMTVSFHPFMCHVGILLTLVGHLHDCIIPPIYVSCKDFTYTGMTTT